MIPDKWERKGHFAFVEAWRFPKEVSEFIKDWLKNLKIDEKDLAHLFCGKSKIGYPRIDINPDLKPDIAADIFYLVKISVKFKNILVDLPWKISYSNRMKFSYAIRDLTKKGGLILFNCPWNPEVKGLKFIRVYKVMQRFNLYRDLTDIWLFEKI